MVPPTPPLQLLIAPKIHIWSVCKKLKVKRIVTTKYYVKNKVLEIMHIKLAKDKVREGICPLQPKIVHESILTEKGLHLQFSGSQIIILLNLPPCDHEYIYAFKLNRAWNKFKAYCGKNNSLVSQIYQFYGEICLCRLTY